jgi:hypothetical protein
VKAEEKAVEGVGAPRLVCAQHGRSLNGVQVPCVKIEMNKNHCRPTGRAQCFVSLESSRF